MKLKKFFIDNKLKIKEIFGNILNVLIFLIIVFSVYSCGFLSGSYLEKSEEINKNELVNRKEANNNFPNDFEFQIALGYSTPSLVDSIYYSDLGNLTIALYPNVYLTDSGIYFKNNFISRFPNGREYYYSNSNNFIEVSYDDLGLDLDLYSIDSYIDISITTAGYNLPFAPDASDYLIWELGIDYEIEFFIADSSYFGDFHCDIIYDVRELVVDDYWLDSNDDWINYFNSIIDYDEFDTIKEGLNFYSGSNPYYFYNNTYNAGYDVGFDDGLPKNIFYYDLKNDSPVLLVYDDVSFIRPDDYDEDLLFKNNYLDLQYLRSLYGYDYSKFRIIFTDSIYSLKDLYLSLDNSSLNDYNILVNGKAYSINSSGTLNIPSSELLQVMEFDSSLLDSTRLVNSSPDFANGFNSGYENGYQNGYDEGVDEEETRYEELIIPAVKVEFEQIGFDKGYQKGKNDTLNDGSGVALFDAFTLIGKGFEVWNPILNMQIIPGFTLGVFIAIPIIIGVVFIVIKLLER